MLVSPQYSYVEIPSSEALGVGLWEEMDHEGGAHHPWSQCPKRRPWRETPSPSQVSRTLKVRDTEPGSTLAAPWRPDLGPPHFRNGDELLTLTSYLVDDTLSPPPAQPGTPGFEEICWLCPWGGSAYSPWASGVMQA